MTKTIFYLFLLTYTYRVVAQQDYVPKIIPPSPTARQFQKYGDYPVGNYTGVPSISIPLYTIEANGISVPISISYHASGMKPNDPSGAIGVGWSLNSGGMISRTIKGQPDDIKQFPVPFYTAEQLKEQGWYERDYLYFSSISRSEGYDLEPDVFSYSILGKNGKFVLSTDNEKRAIFFPLTSNKLIHDIGQDYGQIMKRITIKSSDGTVFRFGKSLDESTQAIETVEGAESATGWFLTDIVSATSKDVVKYKYQYSDIEIFEQWTSFRTIYDRSNDCMIYRSCFTESSTRALTFRDAIRRGGTIGEETTSSQILNTRYSTMFPQEIKFPNGKVLFIANASTKMIEKIEIYTSDNTLIKTIGFDLVKVEGRYFLKGLVVKDNTGQSVENYGFDYEQINWSNVRADRNEPYSTDYWGFNNGQGIDLDVLPRWYSTTSNGCSGYGGYLGSASRMSNEWFMKKFVLNKISFPTGGYTKFDYEVNRSESIKAVGPEILQAVGGAVGGLRIKDITNHTETGVITEKKSYVYEYPYMDVVPTKDKYMYEQVGCLLPGPEEVFAKFNYSSEPMINITPLGSAVVYGRVTEYHKSGEDVINGKIEYNYDIESTQFDFFSNNGAKDFSGGDISNKIYQKEIKDWSSGQLSSKLSYKYENSAYHILKSEIYDYEEVIGEKVRGTIYDPFFYWHPDSCGSWFGAGTSCPSPEECMIRKSYLTYAGITSYWNYADYYVVSGVKLLKGVTTLLF